MRFDYQKVNSLEELRVIACLFNDVEYGFCLELYHYTNSENQKYIVKDDCIDLRFTRADKFASDPNEGKHAIILFRKACNKAVQEHKISAEFGEIIISAINDFNPMCQEYRNQYVFCFSKNHRNKKLIDEYAHKNNKSGVIIGIQSINIVDMVNDKENIMAFQLIDVRYGEESLLENICNLFVRMYELKDQDDDNYSKVRSIIINLLCIYCLACKDANFKDEEETRMIINYDKVKPNCKYVSIGPNDEIYLHCLISKKCLYHIEEI